MQFGRSGKIKAFLNQGHPEERLRFWTTPEIEIDLASELGVQIFRLGIDWGRIHPTPERFDEEAIARYRVILELVRTKGMKVMLTLFHFSLPEWLQDRGGWTATECADHFEAFAKKVMPVLDPLVDYWITLNEPQVFATMAYGLGIFPPGKSGKFLDVRKSLQTMIAAHKRIYTWAHGALPSPKIGIAQHLGVHKGHRLRDRLLSRFTGNFMNWYVPDRIREHMDYFGFNFYGAEWIRGASVEIRDELEYSEAGRAVYPHGLFELGREITRRYPGLELFITENGVSDATDWLRPAYLVEHLRAVSTLIERGITVLGYVHWTLTDNLEWSDGYAPKFGLVSVDRQSQELRRTKRPSFFLYKKIIEQRTLLDPDQADAWSLLQRHVGDLRPFCRLSDGKTGTDEPITRPVSAHDWRFVSSG